MTRAILAFAFFVCSFSSVHICNANDFTPEEKIEYVEKVWDITSDGVDATEYFTDKLMESYGEVTYSDYISMFIASAKLSVKLERGDYYGAARTIAEFAEDTAITTVLEELKLTGEAAVVGFASGVIAFSLDYFVRTVSEKTFNEQYRFYEIARSQLGLSYEEILAHPTGNDDILFDDSGWIYALPQFNLSLRAGTPFFASSAKFFVVAEKLYQQKLNRILLQEQERRVEEVFRTLCQPAGPKFTTDLVSQTIIEGESATLSVSVSGDAPFQYVWSFNGVTTETTDQPTLSASEAGTYQVIAFDSAYRSAHSKIVSLYIVPAGAPLTLSSPAAGTTLTGTFTVRGSSPQATRMEFWLDGSMRYTATAAPFTWIWDTTKANDGSHQILAKAYNGVELLGVTPTRPVTINNSYSGMCSDVTEPNNSSITGTWLMVGGTTNAFICTPTDVDWFRLPVTSAGNVNISLQVPPGADYDLELYGPDAKWVAGSYKGKGMDEMITFNALQQGMYYARVYGYPFGNGSFSAETPYIIGATYLEGDEDLVAYYPFDGNANDLSKYNNHGVNHGAILTSNRFGKANSAFAFDGITSHISIPDSESLGITNDFSLSVWVNPAGIQPQGLGFIFSKYFQWILHVNNSFTVEFNALNQRRVAQTQITTNNWHHIAVTYKRAAQLLSYYIDGVADVSSPQFFSITNGGGDLTIGAHMHPFFVNYGGYGFPYYGTLDEIYIYKRALSEPEVLSLYNSNDGQNLGDISISSQPSSPKVSIGSSTVLSVSAEGSGPLTYQWQRNGVDIEGATSAAYETPALASSDNGAVFCVRITSPTSSVYSTPAVASVSLPRIFNLRPLSTGGVQFDVNFDDFRPRVVLASTNLVDWFPIATNNSPNSVFHLADPGSPDFPGRFYKAVVR